MKTGNEFKCNLCGYEDRIFIYHLRLKGMNRHLCAPCLLRNLPSSFCPICFDIYEDTGTPPLHHRASCLKCPSLSHLLCVNLPNDHLDRYLCPSCSDPSFNFFHPCRRNPNSSVLHEERPNSCSSAHESNAVFDKKSTKVLLTAARISYLSMLKSANVARIEAERKVRESSIAKKRVVEALDRVTVVVSRDGRGKSIGRDARSLSVIPSMTAAVHKRKYEDDAIPPRLQK